MTQTRQTIDAELLNEIVLAANELKFWLFDWRIEITRRKGRWSLLVARSGTIGRRYGCLGQTT